MPAETFKNTVPCYLGSWLLEKQHLGDILEVTFDGFTVPHLYLGKADCEDQRVITRVASHKTEINNHKIVISFTFQN